MSGAARQQRRPEPGLLPDADCGERYRGHSRQHRLTASGIRPSKNCKGTCWDMALMESFFCQPKVGFAFPKASGAFEALRAGLSDWLEIVLGRPCPPHHRR